MEAKELTKEQLDLLKAPLPSEAVSPHPTKPYLSTIKAIYVVERLNDVFGIGGWTLKSDFVEKSEKWIVVKAYLSVPQFHIFLEAFGGNDNSDLGDAYKGATTDALTKMASYIGIGMNVFKGIQTGKSPTSKQKQAPTQALGSENSEYYKMFGNFLNKAKTKEELADTIERIKSYKDKFSQNELNELRGLYEQKKNEIANA